jgi:hypothetical protein
MLRQGGPRLEDGVAHLAGSDYEMVYLAGCDHKGYATKVSHT